MAASASMKRLDEFKRLIATPDLPELGPGPRKSVLPLTTLNEKLDKFLRETALPPAVHPLLRAAALLWHDHLDALHALSQDIHNADGSFLHGIMHRREPDYSNAKYWFHRVGQHPCFAVIAGEVTAWLADSSESKLVEKLTLRGKWDPIAFVDACKQAALRPQSDPQVCRLQEIQRIEFNVMLEHFCQSGKS
jgi:hypothetical protein